MWPCAIGSREETARGACCCFGKGRSPGLCGVILNAAKLFAGLVHRQAPASGLGASGNGIEGLPWAGDRSTGHSSPFASREARNGCGVRSILNARKNLVNADARFATPSPSGERLCCCCGPRSRGFSISPRTRSAFSLSFPHLSGAACSPPRLAPLGRHLHLSWPAEPNRESVSTDGHGDQAGCA